MRLLTSSFAGTGSKSVGLGPAEMTFVFRPASDLVLLYSFDLRWTGLNYSWICRNVETVLLVVFCSRLNKNPLFKLRFKFQRVLSVPRELGGCTTLSLCEANWTPTATLRGLEKVLHVDWRSLRNVVQQLIRTPRCGGSGRRRGSNWIHFITMFLILRAVTVYLWYPLNIVMWFEKGQQQHNV